MMDPVEIKKIKARIAKAERRIAKGYVAKGETEQDRAARLAAVVAPYLEEGK